jgi:hypothetical protein
MEENKNTKIHNEELVQAKPEEANLRIVADQAKESLAYFEYQAKARFHADIHAIVDAVIRGEIDGVRISRYNDEPTFYICNNGIITATAYGIEDVADVINEALAATKKEETEQ